MQGLVRKVAAAAVLLSCHRTHSVPLPDAAATVPAVVSLARSAVADARSQIPPSGCIERARYLALRRSLARAIPLVRYSFAPLAELIVGPAVVIGETAGTLAELDLARDCDEQRKALFQIDRALQLLDAELARHGPDKRAVIHGLSDAAFLLGAEALESTAGTPNEADAVEADLDGLQSGIEDGARAFATDHGVKVALPARPHGRLAMTLASAALGEELRAMGARAGVTVGPLYEPLVAGPVSALTLPKSLVATSPARVALGDALFHARKLSRGGARACTGCHDPARAWSDGRPTPSSLDAHEAPLLRNTPSLLYAPVAATLHWDGRIRTADAQALNVIHARAEMGLSTEELLRVLAADPPLRAQFVAAFDDGITEANVGHALAAYESSVLVPARSPLDRLSRGDTSGWSDELTRGLEVFARRGRCARCHVPPTFGGSRPPDFTAPIYAVLGVPNKPGSKQLDADPGRFAFTKKPQDLRAFRTPTVRNVGATAPYFHHGAFPSLEEVVDFYDRGGGKALGLDVGNQDPDVRPLALTAEERRVLLVFLREGLREGP